METLLQQAQRLKIFAGLQPGVVSSILDSALREKFTPGKLIMEQGDFSNGKGYIIEEGTVDVWINAKQTATLSVGDMFGEIALLNEEPRSATIIAKSDVKVIVLSQRTLFHMIENDDHTINKEIMRRMEENLENE